jgi:hypothetical protein
LPFHLGEPEIPRIGENSKPPKLLDQLREAIRARHYSIRTENACHDWARRFILFHHRRHPRDLGVDEVTA